MVVVETNVAVMQKRMAVQQLLLLFLVGITTTANAVVTNGRLPVCYRRCAFKCDVLPYILLQLGMWQLCRFFLCRLDLAGLRH